MLKYTLWFKIQTDMYLLNTCNQLKKYWQKSNWYKRVQEAALHCQKLSHEIDPNIHFSVRYFCINLFSNV